MNFFQCSSRVIIVVIEGDALFDIIGCTAELPHAFAQGAGDIGQPFGADYHDGHNQYNEQFRHSESEHGR